MTRFARALGCKDVRELKMKLAQSLAIGQRFILDVPDLEGVQGIYESIISVLETNRRALDLAALKRAVEWISDARRACAGYGRRLDHLRAGDPVSPVPPRVAGSQPERRPIGTHDEFGGDGERCGNCAVARRLYQRDD